MSALTTRPRSARNMIMSRHPKSLSLSFLITRGPGLGEEFSEITNEIYSGGTGQLRFTLKSVYGTR
jgi:hypothetical protein